MTLKILAPNYYSRYHEVVKSLGKGKLVLNLGCGDGFYEGELKKRFEFVIGMDINAQDVKIARWINTGKSINYLVGDGCLLPFKDNVFNEIICVDVIEHIKKDKTLLHEISRDLKKNGYLTITTSNLDFPFTYDPINYILQKFNTHIPLGLWGFGHERLYTKDNLIRLLQKNKFKILHTKKTLHYLTGIFENYYLINLLQPLTKSDPKNKGEKLRDREILIKRVKKKPPRFLLSSVKNLIKLDNFLFKNSKRSLGILVRAKKTG
ncbi:MAG: class I SAM-dependent methyltransferase [Candidatus Thorarchaeota archaeon]